MDRTTWMGSGSGGMAGGDGFCGFSAGGAGGAGGGCGGGTIRLFAANAFRFRASGVIAANGTLGAPGTWGGGGAGRGGDSVRSNPGDPFMYAAGTGGAGGGVLLDLTAVGDMVVGTGAAIRSLGGGAESVNGGTVKVFRPAA
jgi:hypothetical protein